MSKGYKQTGNTSSAPRPAPKPETVRQPPPIQHQTQQHPQPGHTKSGTDRGSFGGKG